MPQGPYGTQPDDLEPARPGGLGRAAKLLTWNRIRRNPGTTTAAAAVAIWAWLP